MSESATEFPPNIALYVRQEIARRTQYKAEKEALKIPPDWLQPDYDEYKQEVARLDSNISKLTSMVIIPIAKKYCPWVEIDQTNPEMTVANILAALPAPESIIRQKLVSARGQ